MVLWQADGPFLKGHLDVADMHPPVLGHALLPALSPEHERAGIRWVGEKMVHRAIARAGPPDALLTDSDNSKWNPRGADWGAWLLRGLIECGHCHVGCNCHKMRGRNHTIHRYYYCRNHDLLRAGNEERRCPKRNIRANELDEYVFQQVRQALLDPRTLIAGEHAVIAGTPINENELIAAQLKHLDGALDSAERERTRLLDAYQAGLLQLDNLTRRTATLTSRRMSSSARRTRSLSAAPSSPPRTAYAAGSPALLSALPSHSTTSTTKHASACYASSSRKFA
jgi:Recombinase zinc beta ribbon domain